MRDDDEMKREDVRLVHAMNARDVGSKQELATKCRSKDWREEMLLIGIKVLGMRPDEERIPQR
jgi:hypothetical protein